MNFIYYQKTKKQTEQETQQKIADDFTAFLDRMTPEQRKQFWEQHDKATNSSI